MTTVEAPVVDAARISGARGRRGRVVRRLVRSPLAVTGLVVLTLAVLVARVRTLLAPYSPDQAHFDARFVPPGSPGFLLGTDSLGRDILSRIMFGARASLLVGVLVRAARPRRRCAARTGCGLLPRAGRGHLAVHRPRAGVPVPDPRRRVGRHPGRVLVNAALAIGIAQVPGVIRIIRSETLRLKSLDFVAAAVVGRRERPVGAGPPHPAQRDPRAPRAGHRRDPGRDPGRGGAVLPRSRHPATGA